MPLLVFFAAAAFKLRHSPFPLQPLALPEVGQANLSHAPPVNPSMQVQVPVFSQKGEIEEKRKEERISGDFKQQQQQQQQPKLYIPVVRSHNPRFEHSTIACAVFVVVASSNHAAP